MFSSALEVIHRTTQRRWNDVTSDRGITHSEWEYLRAIQQHQNRSDGKCLSGQHLQDVAQSVGVSKASASTAVGRLEARGLVNRVPCRLDARAQHLNVSNEGHRMIREGERVYQEIERELSQLISPSTLSALRHAFADPE